MRKHHNRCLRIWLAFSRAPVFAVRTNTIGLHTEQRFKFLAWTFARQEKKDMRFQTSSINMDSRSRSTKRSLVLLCELSTSILNLIQLFWERLSHKTLEAYATMSKGIAGNGDLRCLDWSCKVFQRDRKEQDKHVYSCFPFLLAETPWTWRMLKFCGTTLVETAVNKQVKHEPVLLSSYLVVANRNGNKQTLLCVSITCGL